MNTEDYCTYKQSVLLKELGFDWETYAFYSENRELYHILCVKNGKVVKYKS